MNPGAEGRRQSVENQFGHGALFIPDPGSQKAEHEDEKHAEDKGPPIKQAKNRTPVKDGHDQQGKGPGFLASDHEKKRAGEQQEQKQDGKIEQRGTVITCEAGGKIQDEMPAGVAVHGDFGAYEQDVPPVLARFSASALPMVGTIK